MVVVNSLALVGYWTWNVGVDVFWEQGLFDLGCDFFDCEVELGVVISKVFDVYFTLLGLFTLPITIKKVSINRLSSLSKSFSF